LWKPGVRDDQDFHGSEASAFRSGESGASANHFGNLDDSPSFANWSRPSDRHPAG
jgi:hypothetical protein